MLHPGDRVRIKATQQSATVLLVTDCSQSVDVTVVTDAGLIRDLDEFEVELSPRGTSGGDAA
jgi:hypothetical protein